MQGTTKTETRSIDSCVPGQSQRSAVQADCIRRSSKILDERRETTVESAKAKAPAEESDARRCTAWHLSRDLRCLAASLRRRPMSNSWPQCWIFP